MTGTRTHLMASAAQRLRPYVDEQSLHSFVARTTPPWSWLPRLLRVGAVTLGSNVAFRTGRYDETTARGLALIAHECVHVRQYREMGTVRFLLAYARGAVQTGFVHDRHPLELDANRLQQRVRAELEVTR